MDTNKSRGERIMAILEKVWGYTEGKCAWCLSRRATDFYEDYDSQDELVEYQVCARCKKER